MKDTSISRGLLRAEVGDSMKSPTEAAMSRRRIEMFCTNRACSAGRGRGRAPRAEEVHLPAATSGVSQQQDARPVRLRSGAATQPRPGARTGHRALSGRASAGADSGAVWPRQKPSGAGAGPLRAVRQGVDVTFATCTQLTAALNAARATGGYERKLANLARVSLLIIDPAIIILKSRDASSSWCDASN